MGSKLLEKSISERDGYLALLILKLLFFLTLFFFPFFPPETVYSLSLQSLGRDAEGEALSWCSLTVTIVNKASV